MRAYEERLQTHGCRCGSGIAGARRGGVGTTRWGASRDSALFLSDFCVCSLRLSLLVWSALLSCPCCLCSLCRRRPPPPPHNLLLPRALSQRQGTAPCNATVLLVCNSGVASHNQIHVHDLFHPRCLSVPYTPLGIQGRCIQRRNERQAIASMQIETQHGIDRDEPGRGEEGFPRCGHAWQAILSAHPWPAPRFRLSSSLHTPSLPCLHYLVPSW